MDEKITSALSSAVINLLRPLVRILLRNGVPYGAFADLAKRAYVEVGATEFGIPGRKQSKARVAIITGLSRKEVLRVMRLPAPDDSGAAARYNRAARVVAGWVRDARFHDDRGKPRALALEGNGATFDDLVKSYSGDAPTRAVLDELARVGAVERMEGGLVRLTARSYVPRTSGIDKIGILGADVGDLVATIGRNIADPGNAVFQRKVCYDNLPEEALPGFKRMAAERCQDLLESFDLWLSWHDRDANPGAGGTGRKRAGVGIFYFEGDPAREGPR